MTDQKLSIIIPVFNAEQYIGEAIQCIVDQTIFNLLDVIIVNDGSTDRTAEIINKYNDDFSNIRVYAQSNRGVSAARNLGLDYAESPYIAFADADDVMDENFYEKMLLLIEKNHADIALGDFTRVYSDKCTKKYRSDFMENIEGKKRILINFFEGKIGNNLFDKVFRKELLSDICFDTAYRIGEDMLFIYHAISNADTIAIDTSIAGYKYRVRENSAMNVSFSDKYFDPVSICKHMLSNTEADEELYPYAYAHYMHEICKVIEYMERLHASDKYLHEKKELLNELHSYDLVTARKHLLNKQFYGMALMKLSPWLYMKIHRLMRIG